MRIFWFIFPAMLGLGSFRPVSAGEMSPVLPSSPPPRVKLTGIAVLPPDKWAVLEVQEYRESAVAVALTEGARRLSVRVMAIDPRASWAIVRIGATEMELTVDGAATPVVATADGGEHRPLPLLPPPGSGDP